jgi:hypothetical protein
MLSVALHFGVDENMTNFLFCVYDKLIKIIVRSIHFVNICMCMYEQINCNIRNQTNKSEFTQAPIQYHTEKEKTYIDKKRNYKYTPEIKQ